MSVLKCEDISFSFGNRVILEDASFVMNNNFSVYKLPKFHLYVPEDGFVLTPVE